MAAQLKINATSPVSLREMAGTDYDYTTYQIFQHQRYKQSFFKNSLFCVEHIQ
jgi:hypothetical protein